MSEPIYITHSESGVSGTAALGSAVGLSAMLPQKWSGQNSLIAPPEIYAGSKRIRSDAQLGCPFFYSLGFSVKRQEAVRALIQILFGLRCPSAILRGVRPFIINTIQSHSIRARPHISVIVLKGHPPGANADTSTAIIWERLVRWVSASLNHRKPSLVISRAALAVCAMAVPLMASARSCLAACEIAAIDLFFGSAFTANEPSRSAATVNGTAYNSPSTERLARQIYESRHRSTLTQSPVFMGVKS